MPGKLTLEEISESSLEKIADQGWLIDRMDALGYDIIRKGMCNGISHMLMQAILLKKVPQYINRLITLSSISVEGLPKEIERVKEEYKKILGKEKNKNDSLDHSPLSLTNVR